MFAAIIARQASRISKITSHQCRGYLRKPDGEYRPLVKIPGIKESTHFKRDRMDEKDVELVYKSPQISFEMFPPFGMYSNTAIVGFAGWALLSGYPVSEREGFAATALLPQTETDLALAVFAFSMFGIGVYLFAKCNVMRIYYHMERQHFIASHCNPLWFNTRTTIIQPGAPKPSRINKMLLAIPGLMFPQYVDPMHFKTPDYYHVFTGKGTKQNLKKAPADDVGGFF